MLSLFNRLATKQMEPEEREGFVAGDASGVFEALTLAAIVTDRDAQVLASNKAAKVLFGEVPEAAPIFLKFRFPEARIAFDTVLKTEAAAHFEYHERVPIERWFRVDVSPLHDAKGQISGCLFLFRDTSESRNIERMRADFVANASHELRTPLASLSGFIETLKGPARNDEKARDHFLNIMQTQADRMARLIDDLLSLSRLEMRPYADLVDQVEMVAMARQVVDTLGPAARDNDVEIIVEVQDKAMFVNGVRDELVEVMENLIENACKYGRSGKKVVVSLKFGSGADEGMLLFSVKDFGPGIAQEHLPRLTERFYRADSGNDPSQKGTGLGLSIVKHIISRHQGRLAVASVVGQGSTFVAILPISRSSR